MATTPQAPPQAAIEYLKANPGFAPDFDAKYGEGSSAKALPKGIGEHAIDIGRGLVHGAINAVNETVDTVDSAAKFAGEHLGDIRTSPGGGFEVLSPSEVRAANGVGLAGVVSGKDPKAPMFTARVPNVDAPSTVPGQLADGFSQFVTGLVGLGKLTKLAKIPEAVGAVGKIAAAAAKSATVSAVAFDPYEGNVANFVEQFPSMRNPVSDFFAVGDDDSEATARLKNAMADVVVGVPIDSVLTGLKALRAKAHGDLPGAQAHLEQLAEGEHAPPAEAPVADPAAPPAASIPNPPIRPAADMAKELMERVKSATDEANLGAEVTAGSKPPVNIWDNFFSGKEDFNFRKILEASAGKEPYAALSVIDELGKAFRTEIDDARGGAHVSLEETKQASDAFARKAGQNPDEFFGMLAGDAKSAEKVSSRLVAYKSTVLSLAESVQKLAQMHIEGRPGAHGTMDELGAELMRRNEFLSNVLAMTKVVQTGTARAVSAGRLGARVNPRLLKAIEEGKVSGQLTPDKKSLDIFARAVAGAGSPEEILPLVSRSKGQIVGDAISRFWINNILSGPATHVVNAVSNAIKTVVMPAERFASGVYGGNKQEMAGAMRSYYEIGNSLTQAFRVARRAFNDGKNVLDAKAAVQDEGYHQKSNQMLVDAIESGNYGHAMLLSADILLNLPTRLLASSDEFFKQINYRTQVASSAWAEGRARGLKAGDLDTHIENKMGEAFDAEGHGTDEAALGYAQDATFTQDLKPGLASSLQIVKQMNPWMNLVLPFVKTPSNIINDWRYRSGLHGGVYEDIAAGGARRSQAFAKLTTGATFYTMATYAAQGGNLTGMGPQDPETKKLWKAAGNQPYSVKVGDKWLAYNRFDPFGMFLGFAGDIHELAAHRDDRDGQKLMEMALMSVSRNLSNKTYFRGLADVMDALFERGPTVDDKVSRLLNGYASGFMPMSGFVASLKDDPEMREVRTMLDSLASRTPGYSNQLDPQRNILGEPVMASEVSGLSPVAVTTNREDKLAEELYRVFEASGEQVQKPPKVTGNVDWTTFKSKSGQSAYDRFLQLHHDMGLRSKMEEVMKMPGYQKLSPYGRADAFRSVQGRIRAGARGKLYKEFPELADAVRQQERLDRLKLIQK